LLEAFGQFCLRAAAGQRVTDDLQYSEPRVAETEFGEVGREHTANAMGRAQDIRHNTGRLGLNGFDPIAGDF
jgi:hypothetical protein